jgi:hypothetical protein
LCPVNFTPAFPHDTRPFEQHGDHICRTVHGRDWWIQPPALVVLFSPVMCRFS